MELEIEKVLVVAAEHLEHKIYTDLKLDLEYVSSNMFSSTVWVGHETTNEELASILLFAKQNGCDYVKFDEDASVLECFKEFQW